jgi:hypothetical protein
MFMSDEKVKMSVIAEIKSRGRETFTPEDLKLITQAAQNGITDDDEIVEDVSIAPVEHQEQIVPLDTETPLSPTQAEAVEASEIKRQHEQLLEQMRVEKEESNRILREEIELLKSNKSETVEPVEHYDVVAELDGLNRDDYTTDFDFLMARQALTEKLLRTQSVRDPRLDKILPEVEVITQNSVQAEADAKAAENSKYFQNTLKDFWKNVPSLKPTQDYAIVEREYMEFKTAISDKLGFSGPEADRTFAQLHNPYTRDSMKAVIEAKGIAIPVDFDAIYGTLAIYDYQQGRATDPLTGVAVDILGPNRKRVQQSSMEDAHYLMDRKQFEINQKRDTALQYQQQIEKVSGGAVTFPTERLDSVTIDDAFTIERAAEIFSQVRADPHSWGTDPDKIRLKNQAKSFVNG